MKAKWFTKAIPDIIENFENAAEQWYDKNTKYNKETKKILFKCGCGEWEDIEKGHPIDDNPYSPPVCGKCLEKMLNARSNN